MTRLMDCSSLSLSDALDPGVCVCVYYCSTYYIWGSVFINAVPITKLFAWGGEGGEDLTRDDGTREEPGTVTQGGAPFSLVPLVWQSNPQLQGGWLSASPTASPLGDLIPTIGDLEPVRGRRPRPPVLDCS